MGSRILTLQRQARELGRLRTGTLGTSAKGKPQPSRSKTWIVTSQAKHYIEAAAAEWGGTVEAWQPNGKGAQQWRVVTQAPLIDAILPPGDPLSQSLELWSAGGCARRCDGYTETLSDNPCICRADYGEQFFEIAPKDTVCKMTTRLNVILPSMPDIGIWRVESHSFYAANEIAAAVDMLKSAAGPAAMVPIRLRIEQRTRVAKGQTKHFPVIAVELRGATGGQVLEAVSANGQIVAGEQRRAIEAGRPDYVAQAKAATSRDEFLAVANAAEAAGHMSPELKIALNEIWTANTNPRQQPQPEPEPVGNAVPDEVDGEVVEDPADEDEAERLHGLIIENCPDGWDMTRVNAQFASRNGGTVLTSGTVTELRAFLSWIQGGAQ